jgi:hypothetical protein
MTTAPFEPSHNDPNLRPDTAPDGTPTPAPGVDADAPDGIPADPGDPTQPSPTES